MKRNKQRTKWFDNIQCKFSIINRLHESITILEKLTARRLVTKFTPSHCDIHNCPPPSPVLSHIISVDASHPLPSRSILTLSSHPYPRLHSGRLTAIVRAQHTESDRNGLGTSGAVTCGLRTSMTKLASELHFVFNKLQVMKHFYLLRTL